MTREEIHRLVEEYRDATISLEDALRLQEAIRGGGETAALIRREMELSGFLAQALEGDDEAGFVRSFGERMKAEEGELDFVRAFEKRAAARPQPSSWSQAAPFLVAGGLLVAFAVGFLVRGPSKAPVPPSQEQVRVDPAPAVAPRPEFVPTPVPHPEPPPPPPPSPQPVPLPETPERKPDVNVEPPAPTAPEPPRPVPAPPTIVEKPAAVARIESAEGDVRVGGKAAVAGESIPPAVGLSAGARSLAVVVFSDGSHLLLGAETSLREIARSGRATRVTLAHGSLSAEVTRQPADQPFVVATPHAEARVIGTVFRVVVEPASTRLEVKEGRVRLTREGRNQEISAGQYAVAGARGLEAPRSLHPDEIVLLPAHAKITGPEWMLARDPKSSTGLAIEAGMTKFQAVDHVEFRTSYVTYTFFASAEREYRLWVRATSVERGDSWNRDMVTIEPQRCQLSQKSPFFGTHPTTAYVFTGLGSFTGYAWVSGHGEETKVDGPPLAIRFAETGLQTLKVYVAHPHIRMDAIWLSASQRTRPPARQLPPADSK